MGRCYPSAAAGGGGRRKGVLALLRNHAYVSQARPCDVDVGCGTERTLVSFVEQGARNDMGTAKHCYGGKRERTSFLSRSMLPVERIPLTGCTESFFWTLAFCFLYCTNGRMGWVVPETRREREANHATILGRAGGWMDSCDQEGLLEERIRIFLLILSVPLGVQSRRSRSRPLQIGFLRRSLALQPTDKMTRPTKSPDV